MSLFARLSAAVAALFAPERRPPPVEVTMAREMLLSQRASLSDVEAVERFWADRLRETADGVRRWSGRIAICQPHELADVQALIGRLSAACDRADRALRQAEKKTEKAHDAFADSQVRYRILLTSAKARGYDVSGLAVTFDVEAFDEAAYVAFARKMPVETDEEAVFLETMFARRESASLN